MPVVIDTDPYFAPEAQEVFTEDCRVYAVESTICVGEGAEGTYRGRRKSLAVVDWDTPSGEGFRESVHWDKIRNLYR